MSRLSVYLPGLQRVAPAAPLPTAFSRLLARADWAPAIHTLAQALLAQLGYGTDLPLPVAKLCACHDLALPALEEGWYRADPVHLRADPRLVLLLSPQPGEISPDEAAACLQALNSQLPEGVWRSGRAPERWYVRGPHLGATSPYGPAWVDGRSITPFVSREAPGRAWRTLFNDAQMVLHAVEGNEARLAMGRTPLNAVWLWGGGAQIPPQPVQLACVGNDLLLAGASRGNAVDWRAAATCEDVLALLETQDVALMLAAPWGNAEPAVPVLALDAFARDWAPVLWRALGSSALQAIELIGESHRGRLDATSRWRFWRTRGGFSPGDAHAIVDVAEA